MHKIICCFLLWGLLLPNSQADVNITTTIKPLQLIAEAIVQENGTVTAIIDANASPHHYTMSPSDRLALANAEILLWIGPQFETYLTDFFEQLGNSSKRITVSEAEGLIRHEIAVGQLDSHLWLDTRNAVLIAELITAKASTLDAEHAAVFSENLRRFKSAIETSNAEIEKSLSASPKAAYAVYHNAYQYFERQFGLQHQFAMLSDPEVQPGIREIIAVRRRFDEERPACLLLEPDSNQQLVATALAEHDLTLLTVDLLGYTLASSPADYPSAYPQFMRNLANTFVDCLY